MIRRVEAYFFSGCLLAAAVWSFGQTAQETSPEAPPVDPNAGISQPGTTPLGSMLALPMPEERKDIVERYEIPELAGAYPMAGSALVDGKLPRPLVDYITRAGGQFQRISLFENGVVSVHVKGNEGVIQKKLILPADALEDFVEWLNPDELAATTVRDPGDAHDVAVLRMVRSDGTRVERRFAPSTVLQGRLERQRLLLEDLLRAIAEDREVTSALAMYQPVVGDRLLGEDRKMYEVRKILKNGEIVELRSLSEPVSIFYATSELKNRFVAARRPGTDE